MVGPGGGAAHIAGAVASVLGQREGQAEMPATAEIRVPGSRCAIVSPIAQKLPHCSALLIKRKLQQNKSSIAVAHFLASPIIVDSSAQPTRIAPAAATQHGNSQKTVIALRRRFFERRSATRSWCRFKINVMHP